MGGGRWCCVGVPRRIFASALVQSWRRAWSSWLRFWSSNRLWRGRLAALEFELLAGFNGVAGVDRDVSFFLKFPFISRKSISLVEPVATSIKEETALVVGPQETYTKKD
ncbi:hypothetical protein CASFOL_022731 [Castilleja foliolosa]|uniref:Secreted protein n=1 Tax=Castilleja foliolosa TaxID=1961234 RepID=A0ABD3CXW4_9LAMI